MEVVQLLVTWFDELVSLLPALCLRNAESSRSLYIGISCREEVVRRSLTFFPHLFFVRNMISTCVTLYVLVVSKQSWESSLSSHRKRILANTCVYSRLLKGWVTGL